MPRELAALVVRSEYPESGKYFELPANAAICISVDGRDADEKLLASLRGLATSVVPLSRCVYVADPRDGSYEIGSRRPAVLIKVVMLGPDQVQYSSYRHLKWGTNVILKVHKAGEAWRIDSVLTREVA